MQVYHIIYILFKYYFCVSFVSNMFANSISYILLLIFFPSVFCFFVKIQIIFLCI